MKRYYIPIVLFMLGAFTVSVSTAESLEEVAFEKLSVRIKKEKLSSKDCEELGHVDKTGGKVNLNRGGQMSFKHKFEGCQYQLDLRNNQPINFEQLKIECRFFYTVERSWRARKKRSEEELKYFDWSSSVSLKASTKDRVTTDPFVMHSSEVASGVYFNNGDPEVVDCSEEGLWVKVTYTTPDGEKEERDFCQPSSLSNRVTWDGKSI